MYRLLRSLILLGLLAAPGLSSALTTLCVSNSQQLAGALQSVNSGSDNLILIKLRRGTYTPPAGSGGFDLDMNISGRVVEVSGGWTGAGSSCTDKNFGATGTLIVGDPAGSALKLDLGQANSGNTVSVTDLTFTAPDGDSGACLHAKVQIANVLTIERTRFERCVTTTGGAGSLVLINSGGEVTLRDSVVRGGLGSITGGISLTTGGGRTYLNQLSIIANRASQNFNPGGLFINSSGLAQIFLNNSLVHGNTAPNSYSDIDNTGSGFFTLSHVHFGVLNGSALQSGCQVGNPGVVAPGNPGLRSDSVLLDTGVTGVDGGLGSFDVDGKARIQGSTVDIGAHEGVYGGDEIFRDIQP